MKLVRGGRVIWIDSGLSRHVDVTKEFQGWPASSQMSQLRDDKVYISSWAGYPPMQNAVSEFCANPTEEFLMNRNHLGGTVVVASDRALQHLLQPWSSLLERMVEAAHWNNEQVMWELLACYFPNSISVLDYHRVLFKELSSGFGDLKITNFNFAQSGVQGLAMYWESLALGSPHHTR